MINKMWFRPDIQGLRCVAVLSVIVFHYFPEALPSGYLGVDVFFVISGFVITRLFLRNKNTHPSKFLPNFFLNRVKRLYPALVVCVFITGTCYALLPIPGAEISLRTGATSLFGLSNLYLFIKSFDYFATVAELNPFTQTWSLGVEEQFYFIFPIILIGSKFFKQGIISQKIILTCTVASLICYIWCGKINTTAQYYLMPFRFWEFTLGYAAAFCNEDEILRKWKNKGLISTTPFISLFFIFCSFFLPGSLKTYGTLVVTIATTALILTVRWNTVSLKLLSLRSLCFLGDISYSLYLWHWPILFFGRYFLGNSLRAVCFLLVLTFLISVCSYFYLELPFKNIKIETRQKKWMFAGSTAGISIACFAFMLTVQSLTLGLKSSVDNFFQVPEPPKVDNIPCYGRAPIHNYTDPYAYCLGAKRTDLRPSVLYLVGDSHAAHLTFMVKTALQETPYQVRFFYPALSDEVPYKYFRSPTAETKTLKFILKNMKPGDILMLAFFQGQVTDLHTSHVPLTKPFNLTKKTKNFIESFSREAKKFTKKGGTVVLVMDTPLLNNNPTVSSCYFQKKYSGTTWCAVSKEQALWTRKNQSVAFDRIKNLVDNTFIWDPLQIMYGDKMFFYGVDGSFTYRMIDSHHISMTESKKLAPFFLKFLFEKGILASEKKTSYCK